MAAILITLMLAALPSASADPAVETSIPDITLEEDDEAVGVIDLNDYFSNDGGQLYYSFITVEGKLEVTIHQNGLVDVSVPADWYGTEVVTFVASDGHKEARDTVLITVSPANDAPFIVEPLPEQLSFAEDEMLSDAFNLNSHFADVDSSLGFESASEEILVHISNDGFVDFSAPPDWHGSEVVMFTASDGDLEMTDAVTVTVVSVNDAPRFMANPGTISLEDDATLNLDEFFMDPDGEALNYEVSGNNQVKYRLREGTIEFSAPEGFRGEEIIAVRATDSQGASSSIQVVVVGSGGGSASGLLFYSFGLVLALAVTVVRLSTARERRPPRSPVKLDDYRHFIG